MSKTTTNLGLYEVDPATDGALTFNIKTMLNDNFDKIDADAFATSDQTQVPTGLPGKLAQWVNWITNRIKAITGNANWYDTPPTTLTAANTHMANTSNPHSVTATQAGAIPTTVEGVANGVATLDSAGKVPLTQLGNVPLPANATASATGLVEVAAAPTSGVPIVLSQVASAKETQITGTSAQTLATYTPTASGNFEARASFRVVTGATNVTITVGYTSAGGAQTYTALNAQACAVGEYSIVPFAFNAVAGSAITIKITASVANQVYASAGITGV